MDTWNEKHVKKSNVKKKLPPEGKKEVTQENEVKLNDNQIEIEQ